MRNNIVGFKLAQRRVDTGGRDSMSKKLKVENFKCIVHLLILVGLMYC